MGRVAEMYADVMELAERFAVGGFDFDELRYAVRSVYSMPRYFLRDVIRYGLEVTPPEDTVFRQWMIDFLHDERTRILKRWWRVDTDDTQRVSGSLDGRHVHVAFCKCRPVISPLTVVRSVCHGARVTVSIDTLAFSVCGGGGFADLSDDANAKL